MESDPIYFTIYFKTVVDPIYFFDVTKDLEPIGLIAEVPLTLVAKKTWQPII